MVYQEERGSSRVNALGDPFSSTHQIPLPWSQFLPLLLFDIDHLNQQTNQLQSVPLWFKWKQLCQCYSNGTIYSTVVAHWVTSVLSWWKKLSVTHVATVPC